MDIPHLSKLVSNFIYVFCAAYFLSLPLMLFNDSAREDGRLAVNDDIESA